MKRAISLFLIFLFLIPLVLGSTTIVQQQPAQEEKQGVFAQAIGFLKSPIFLGLLLFIFIFVVLGIASYFLITWLIRYLKEQKDLMLLLKRKRIALAKSQKRFKTHFLRVTKNIPIRLVRENKGRAEVSKPIGYYRGDYSTHEGNLVIAFNLEYRKKLFILPITDILVVPNKKVIEINRRNKKGEIETETIRNIPTAKEIVQFNENEVLVYAESISDVGEFYIPVLKSQEGSVMDLSLPVFHTLRKAIFDNYLYDQTSLFATLSKKGLEINPFIRTVQKIQDSGQNQETPQGVGGNK